MVASHMVADSPDNPSTRRHGLIIDFECETCSANPIQLRFAQHKGTTLVSWRYTTDPGDDVAKGRSLA
jgi:hypothetical protein